MSESTDTPIDEDAVAEIPPGSEHAGSVQGGGSDISQQGSGSSQSGDDAGAGQLDDLDVEIVDEDKGATGE